MTLLLDEAIETLRELPEDEQEAAVDALFAYISSEERCYSLRADQAEAVSRIRRDLKTGRQKLAGKDAGPRPDVHDRISRIQAGRLLDQPDERVGIIGPVSALVLRSGRLSTKQPQLEIIACGTDSRIKLCHFQTPIR